MTQLPELHYIDGQQTLELPNVASWLGQGVFETIRLRFVRTDQQMTACCLGLDRHYLRFKQAATRFGCQLPSQPLFIELLSQAGPQLKVASSCDYRARFVAGPDHWSLSLLPWSPAANFMTGIKLLPIVVTRSWPEFKTCSALASQEARQRAEAQGYDEALLIDEDQIVREGAWSNFFWIDSDLAIRTTTKKVLPGITLGITLEIAESFGLKIIDQEFALSQMKNRAVAAFITQATHGIALVNQVEQTRLNGDLAIELINKLREQYEDLALNSMLNCWKL